MENSDLQKTEFATDAFKSIKDRIKVTFAELIPDENWSQLVETEVQAFFAPSPHTRSFSKTEDGWKSTKYTMSSSEEESPFRRLVWDLCYESTINILLKKLQSEYVESIINNHLTDSDGDLKEKKDEFLSQMLEKAIIQFFKHSIQQNAHDIASMFQNRLR